MSETHAPFTHEDCIVLYIPMQDKMFYILYLHTCYAYLILFIQYYFSVF